MLFSVAVICFVFVCLFVCFVLFLFFFNLFYFKSFIYYKIEIVLGNNIFRGGIAHFLLCSEGGGGKYVYLYYLGALRLLFCEFCSEYRVNRVRIEYRIE